jgi:peptidoglycan/LPS O-acetylase OafA/YrhL
MSGSSKRRAVLGDLDLRNNSIGFLRFFFAATVIWSHAHRLGGFGDDPLNRINMNAPTTGFLAVGGFFVLSGFLITRSYETVGNIGRFVWHRFLRIFPGFWVCLVVTAFGLAPLAFFYEHGTVRGYLAQVPAPWSYVASNLLLGINQQHIGSVLTHVPSPLDLNLSLWTLNPEFFCYLCIAALGVAGVLRRAPAIVATIALLLLVVYTMLLWRYGDIILIEVEALFVYFAFGSYAYLIRNRLPMSPWIAALCGAALLGTITTRAFTFVAIPCIAYLTLFGAMRLPFRNFDRRMDLSYGLYIYAFPIQQLLALYGLNAVGFTPYFLGALAITCAFAATSWFTIERPSLSLKHLALVPSGAQSAWSRYGFPPIRIDAGRSARK